MQRAQRDVEKLAEPQVALMSGLKMLIPFTVNVENLYNLDPSQPFLGTSRNGERCVTSQK